MKDWTKKTMIKEDERMNGVKIENKNEKRNKANDVAQKELCKIYCKTSIITYSIDTYRYFFWVFDYALISLFTYKHLN